MMFFLTTLSSLFAVASAVSPASYPGFHTVWSDDFGGQAGSAPEPSKWNVISTSSVFNNEHETYTNGRENMLITGNGHLQLIPLQDSRAVQGWTSGRIESKYTFVPTPGKITRLESQLSLALGSPWNKRGIWPAFWLNGESYRHGIGWPGSGEVDIMENINGDGIGHGVIHCDRAPGGVCNEPIGIASTVNIADSNAQTWRVDFDRQSNDFSKQSITWYHAGREFHRITGAQVNNADVWASLAQKPMYIIFNVAVGGDWVSLTLMAVLYLANIDPAWAAQRGHPRW